MLRLERAAGKVVNLETKVEAMTRVPGRSLILGRRYIVDPVFIGKDLSFTLSYPKRLSFDPATLPTFEVPGRSTNLQRNRVA
jgi:hypothetical protein